LQQHGFEINASFNDLLKQMASIVLQKKQKLLLAAVGFG
jgi:hypothetical protein